MCDASAGGGPSSARCPPFASPMSAPASPLGGSPTTKPRARSAAFAARIKELEALTKGGSGEQATSDATTKSVRPCAPGTTQLHTAWTRHFRFLLGHPTAALSRERLLRTGGNGVASPVLRAQFPCRTAVFQRPPDSAVSTLLPCHAGVRREPGLRVTPVDAAESLF